MMFILSKTITWGIMIHIFSPSFHYLDASDRVIYIKSFSTSLFSALRITSMVLPQALLAPVLKLKGTLDYESNLVMQKALSLYIDNGMFAKNKELLHQQQFIQKEQASYPTPATFPIRPWYGRSLEESY